jgi:hypothetical protein
MAGKENAISPGVPRRRGGSEDGWGGGHLSSPTGK